MSKSKVVLIGIGIVIIILVALFVNTKPQSTTSSKKTSSNTTQTQQQTAKKSPTTGNQNQANYPVYKASTTIPSTWENYSNNQYGFSISYPSNWSTNESSDKSVTVYANNNSINYFNVTFRSPGTNGPSKLYYSEAVTNQTLSQNLNNDIQSLVTNNNSSDSAVTAEQSGTTYYLYEGHPAAKLTTQLTSKTTGLVTYTVDFIVSANGNSYDFSTQSDTPPLSSLTLLTGLESFKIN